MATLRGQNLRILQPGGSGGSSWIVIAEATNCVVTLMNNTEELNTKDDPGSAAKPVVASKSWQIQVESLDVSYTMLRSLLSSMKSGSTFVLRWDETSTTDNTTEVTPSAAYSRYGMAYLSDASFTFSDKQISVRSVTFIGSGAIQ